MANHIKMRLGSMRDKMLPVNVMKTTRQKG